MGGPRALRTIGWPGSLQQVCPALHAARVYWLYGSFFYRTGEDKLRPLRERGGWKTLQRTEAGQAGDSFCLGTTRSRHTLW
jgi:hypothetical protein